MSYFNPSIFFFQVTVEQQSSLIEELQAKLKQFEASEERNNNAEGGDDRVSGLW